MDSLGLVLRQSLGNISFNFTVLLIQWGQVICTHTCAVCKDDGETYLHGDTWKSSNDSCLTCRCEVCKSSMSEPISSAAVDSAFLRLSQIPSQISFVCENNLNVSVCRLLFYQT